MSTEGPDDPTPFLGTVVVGQATPPRQYRIERVLGKGSQALTFVASASAPSPLPTVVLKLWRPSFIAENPQMARLTLRKEWEALGRLSERTPACPHVVRLLDAGELPRRGAEALPWLALEPVDGGALGPSLRERVPDAIARTAFAFGPARARRLLAGVAAGLDALHAVGVVHRDLKPNNVLLSGGETDEIPRVSDLGVSRPIGMTTTFGANVSVGSIGYASPEQTDPQRVGPWSDVFSFAALAYFVLTGEPMFSGSLHTVLARIQRGGFEPLGSRPRLHPTLRDPAGLRALEEALRAATRADPRERTPSVAALAGPLDRWLASREGAERDLALASTASEVSALGLAPTGPMENRPSGEPLAPPRLRFRVRFGDGAAMDFRAVAVSSEGQALGLGARGLARWDGTRWLPVALPPDLAPEALYTVAALEPGRFLVGGRQGELAVWTEDGWPVRDRIAAGAVDVVALAGRDDGTFVLAARAHSGATALYAQQGGRWFGPTVLEPGLTLADLCAAGPREALLTGWNAQGKGFLARFRPERGAIEPAAVAAPPLFAVTETRGEAVALGQGGLAVCPSGGIVVASLEATGQSDEVTAAVTDAQGGVWAAAGGTLLYRLPTPRGEAGAWATPHQEPSLRSRAMGLACVRGGLVLVTAGGAVLEGRPEA